MDIKINKNDFVTFDLSRKNNKYRLRLKIKNKYLNYEAYSKIEYEEIISIIENIEGLIFRREVALPIIGVNNIDFDFSFYNTGIEIIINLDENSRYIFTLKREEVIKLYHYLTKSVNTMDKLNAGVFNKKYTYVEVRYIDVYCDTKYSYISEDTNIQVGDIVYVDRAGRKCLAEVVGRNDYYFEQASYPVLATKRIIKIVTKAETYKK